MEFSHIDKDKIYFTAKMKRCRECGEYTFNTRDEDVNGMEVVQLRNKGFRICTDETGVCEPCQKAGDYARQCDICKHYKKYPSEFKYNATEYAEYDGCDHTVNLICIDCVAKYPQKIIAILADADEIETVSR